MYARGMGIILLTLLRLVSLYFFYPITLAYVISWAMRPPWGLDIEHDAWQLSYGWHLWLVRDYLGYDELGVTRWPYIGA